MNRPEITNATVFPKLRIILNEDIEVIDRMMGNKENGSDIYELLDSLKYAKQQILSKLPAANDGLASSPTPASRLTIVGYESDNKIDDFTILSELNKVESDQMEFVRNAVVNEGLPEDLLDKLKEILNIYEKITEQLDRSSKTRQVNSIVI